MTPATVRNVAIDALTIEQVVEESRCHVARRHPGYVCLANVHVVESAQTDLELASALAAATMRLPDGSPVAWATARALSRPVARVTGSDVFDALLREPGLRHFFYGSTDETLMRLRAAVVDRYPAAVVCGVHSPPFRPLTAGELRADAALIDGTRPDIVWVGLGAPRQEIWMARARAHLEAPLLVGVGAVFDFFAGTRARAPRWMQRLGLEWLHRLSQEPRRLGPRYLKTNASFIGWAVRTALTNEHGAS